MGEPSPGSVYYPAQTLTVGVEGLLSRIELEVWRVSGDAPLTVWLFPLLQEFNPPVFGPQLGAVLLTVDEVPRSPGTVILDVAILGVMVHPGERLAIGLQTELQNSFIWAADYPNSYNGGISYTFHLRPLDGPVWYNANSDAVFRTFVDPVGRVPVPEPATLALFVFGLGALLITRRTRSTHD
ncbi:PEP-CTERM sorting domain-containing protein [Roseomonas sp. CCTCC AB2023176]|uniref:PEP-CTERM sorting domain-containing protein n=1 Tax=Roseomonas sp. CCTCC AB2023176 TaxID=3342640 RepID=UPI0035E1A847